MEDGVERHRRGHLEDAGLPAGLAFSGALPSALLLAALDVFEAEDRAGSAAAELAAAPREGATPKA